MVEQADDLPEKVCYSTKLQQTLALEGSPVAIAILPRPPHGLRQWRRKATPCVMLQSARRGSAFYCSGDSIFCSGRAHLGMGEPPVPDLEDFLVQTEKLTASRAAAHKILDTVKKRTPKLGDYLAFSPLEKADFAASNTLKMAPELISRFMVLYFNPYSRQEFQMVTVNVLRKRENVDEDLASYIADRVWQLPHRFADPRQAVRMARLANTKEKVDELLQVLLKYSP